MSPTPQVQETKIIIDYTVRRKIIYKGKMAPKGYIYIVVKAKGVTARKLIKGSQGAEVENTVALFLRERIREEFKR